MKFAQQLGALAGLLNRTQCFEQGKLIGRSLGFARDGVIAVVVPITRSQVVTAGIPTGRAENDEGSTIPQDPPNG